MLKDRGNFSTKQRHEFEKLCRRKFDLTSWLNAQEKRGRDVRAELLAKDNELRKRLKQGKHHV